MFDENYFSSFKFQIIMSTETMNGTQEVPTKEEVTIVRTAAKPVMAAAAVAAVPVALEFKFSQPELQSLAELTGNNKISVTTCSITDRKSPTRVKTMYLCAIAHLADPPDGTAPQMDTSIRPIIGCPFPPPWDRNDALAVIQHSDIVAAPKFFISAADLLAALPNNTHAPIDPADPAPPVGQVSANLDAALLAGKLEFIVSFTMKDSTGTQVGNQLKAIPM
jgi:hypothetical protein